MLANQSFARSSCVIFLLFLNQLQYANNELKQAYKPVVSRSFLPKSFALMMKASRYCEKHLL
jgi:hypothetical protein